MKRAQLKIFFLSNLVTKSGSNLFGLNIHCFPIAKGFVNNQPDGACEAKRGRATVTEEVKYYGGSD